MLYYFIKMLVKYKKRLLVLTTVAILLTTPFGALAINDVTLNGIISFNILTADTAAATTILAQSGGQVTQLDIQLNYIDITLDNASTITFDTTAAGEYIRISKQAGSNDYTVSPTCPTTTATLTGTGAQVVLRLEIYTTNICPTQGGGSQIFPANYSVTINNNSAQTSSRNVTLNLQSDNANQVLISNNNNFIDADWQPFVSPTDKSWTLPAGEGIKNVYVIYKSSDSNMSPVLSDSIEFTSETPPYPEPSEPTEPAEPSEPVVTPDGLNVGDLIKGSLDTVYYYGADGKRHIFPNPKTYFTWYDSFDRIRLVSDELLASIPVNTNITYRPGTRMIKVQSDPKVYAVDLQGALRWVASEKAAEALYGPDWADFVDDLNPAFFINYKIGRTINSAADFDPQSVMNRSPNINTDKNFNSGF